MTTKSLNQRLYEEVLEPRFPRVFKYPSTFPGRDIIEENRIHIKYRQPDISLDDAFWLADKVGLFDNKLIVLSKISDEWLISYNDYDLGLSHISESKSLPEAICLAILEIYGRKV